MGEDLAAALKSGQSADFVHKYTPTAEDYFNTKPKEGETNRKDNIPDGLPEQVNEHLEEPRTLTEEQIRDMADYQRNQLASSLDGVIEQLTNVGLDWKQAEVEVASVRQSGYTVNEVNGAELPHITTVKFSLKVRSKQTTSTGVSFAGSYALRAQSCIQFDRGWTISNGMQLTSLPSGLLSPEGELAFKLRVMATRHPDITEDGNIVYRSITADDDPALHELAKHVVELLAAGDVEKFTKRTTFSVDEVLASYEAMSKIEGIAPPSKAELEKMYGFVIASYRSKAKSFLKLARDLKLPEDPAQFQVNEVKLEYPDYRGGNQPPDIVIMAEKIEISFSLAPQALETRGESYRDTFVIALDQGSRNRTRWTFFDGIRWSDFPKNLLTETQAGELGVANYIAEQGAVPPGGPMPAFSFYNLEDPPKKFSSAELKGKVVVLEFWATWCGPCQRPMQKLQDYVRKHPEWKGKVEVIALSIDDSAEEVRKHLQREGWDKTRNVWAGEGGWRSEAAKVFSVRSIPRIFIIDREGTIVRSSYPIELDIPDTVSQLLDKKAK